MNKRPNTNASHPDTLFAQLGGMIDEASGGVVPPMQPSTTFVRDRNYDPVRADNVYARDNNDVVRLAEKILARSEQADAGLLFPSGMAAIAAVMRTLPGGGRLVMQTGIYWGATKWVREFCARRDVLLHEIDASDTVAVCDLVREGKPDLVWVETPSNPWLKIVNLRALSQACRDAGAVLAVDSTAATPVLSQPLTLGADIVMHSATKAINGHSDVVAGFLACRDAHSAIWQAIAADRHDAGAIIGPFEAWLLLRGMRTLPLRVEKMSSNALTVAQFLDGHDQVEKVLYPGLASAQGHDLAVQQMAGGFGGLLSFLVKGDGPRALRVCGRLDLFHRATSLGGVESLVEHRHTIEGDATGVPENLIRLSVGIENVDELIADLAQALTR